MNVSILNMISAILEVSLIVLFVSIALGLLFSAFIGYRRGVYKSTYKMIGYAVLFTLALITMRPLMKMVYNLPLTGFFNSNPTHVFFNIGGKSIEFDLTISTVEATLNDFIRGFCVQINATDSLNVSISQFAKTMTTSIISLAVYLLDLSLITSLGSLFLEIMWLVCFKKLTPKVAQRVGKIKFVGMAESMVTKLVLFFLAIAPMTSIVNSINQGIQKSNARNSNNETVREIVNLVDLYNNSLFAQAFFNWNTSLNSEGITFDQAIMDFFSKTLNGGEETFSLGSELGNLAYSIGEVASVLGEGNDGVPVIEEFSETLINPVFDLVGNSEFFNSLFEIAVELTLNSDLLDGVIPNYQYFDKVDISEISLSEEIEVFKGMDNDIFESQILDDLIVVENGEMQFNAPTDLVEYLDNLFSLEENRW